MNNLKLFGYSALPSLYIQKNVLQNVWKQNVLCLSVVLSNFKLFCGWYFPILYNHKHSTIYQTKVFCLNDVLSNFMSFFARICGSSIYSQKFVTTLWTQKVLHLNDFLSNFKLFCYVDFRFLHINIYWKIYENKFNSI